MHATAVDARERLGQEGSRHVHLGCHLTAEELVELHLIRGDQCVGVIEVHFELTRCHFGVVLLVSEPHGSLHLGRRIDELAQGIAGKGVIVPTGGNALEASRLVVTSFCVTALEEKALDLRREVGCDFLLLEELIRVFAQAASHVGWVRCAVTIEHFGEHENLPWSEHIGRQPVEGRPVESQAEI